MYVITDSNALLSVCKHCVAQLTHSCVKKFIQNFLTSKKVSEPDKGTLETFNWTFYLSFVCFHAMFSVRTKFLLLFLFLIFFAFIPKRNTTVALFTQGEILSSLYIPSNKLWVPKTLKVELWVNEYLTKQFMSMIIF